MLDVVIIGVRAVDPPIQADTTYIRGKDNTFVFKKKKKNMNVFGYTIKKYTIAVIVEIVNEQCNTGDPLETSGGLY